MTAVQPTATMSGRYQRAFTLAVIFLVAGWHLAGAGGQLLHNRTAYGSFAFQCAMWLVMALAITAGTILVLGVQVRDGLHRTDLAGFLALLAWSTGAQVAVAAGVRALDVAAGQAAAATRSEHAARQRAATAEIIRTARHARWLALQETAVPLVTELAAGTADPGDPHVRIRCALQAARLRRLLAEGDEVPGSLVHELHASADMAERRRVAVDIETAGPLPRVPGPARRVITDAAIAILTAARSQARITLATVAAGIAVSFVADTGAVVRLPAAGEGVAIEQQQDGGMLWAEARWNSR